MAGSRSSTRASRWIVCPRYHARNVVDNPAHIGGDGLLSAVLLVRLASRTVQMLVALWSHGFTMKHQPAQPRETMALIAADHSEMVNTLAIALAIESDRSLQVQLQKLARVSDMPSREQYAVLRQCRPCWSSWRTKVVCDCLFYCFPLMRERTVWLAACAGRSAVAFGEPAIGQYLATLSKAEHPMKAFDALFGARGDCFGS